MDLFDDGGGCSDDDSTLNPVGATIVAGATASVSEGGVVHLEPDSDAVVAPTPLLLRASTKLMRQPVGPWFGVAIQLGLMVQNVFDMNPDVCRLKEGRECAQLDYIRFACTAIANPLVSLTMISLHKVMREGDGHLVQLGLGVTKVSADAAALLKRWNVVLMVLMSPVVLVGIMISLTCGDGCDIVNDRVQFVRAQIFSLSWIYVVPLVLTWYLALKEASLLVSDLVLEVRKQIRDTDFKSPEWDAEVVPKVKELLTHTLPTISHGFGDALLAFWAAAWVLAFGQFSAALMDDGGSFHLINACVFLVFPLFVALDVAGASSDCDSIAASLNDKRADAMDQSDDKLVRMERLLSLANRGQGLGFKVGGKVMDRSTLKMIFIGENDGTAFAFSAKPTAAGTQHDSVTVIESVLTQSTGVIHCCRNIICGGIGRTYHSR
jgi:hypothetical protein